MATRRAHLAGAVLAVGLAAAGCTSESGTPVTAATASSSTSPTASRSSSPSSSPSTSAFVGETFEVGSSPCSFAVGGDRVWVSRYSPDEIVGVDPDDVTDRVTLAGIDTPCTVAWRDGQLWVASVEAHAVVAIDPATGTELARAPMQGQPYDLLSWRDALWVLDRGEGDPSVVRLDPSSGEETGRWPVGATPVSMAVLDDMLWIACRGAHALMRLDAATEELTTVPFDGNPYWLQVLDGTLWVSDTRDGGVVQVDPTSGDELQRVVGPSVETEFTVADGQLWLPDRQGVLWRVDPGDGSIEPIGGLPTGVYYAAPVGDEVWVLEYDGDRVVRVDVGQLLAGG